MHIRHVYENIIEIKMPPQDTTVFLKEIAIFTCEISSGDFVFWRVNGTSFNDLTPEIKNNSNVAQEKIGDSDLITLTILARAEYNGTTVQCVTGYFAGVVVESGIVTMKIQGIHKNMYITYQRVGRLSVGIGPKHH